MNINPGTCFDHYQIIALLGAGGMGEVYLARDTKLERAVALKFLPAEVAAERKRMSRFEQEARATSALNHPNIITIHEIGASDGTHFIATEFVDGETLRLRMCRATLAIEEVLDVASQVASALAAAHEAGIIHRDIKPENIMLRGDRLVKVLDFGLAKLIERQDAARLDSEAATRRLVLTMPGTVVGTIQYTSPEQARGLDVDERTDIWSLGVVLYEMISGRRPFAGATMNDVIAAILNTEPPPLTPEIGSIPHELRRIVQKALRAEREERYQTAKDMLVDLKTLHRELDFSARSGRASGAGHTSRTGQVASAHSSILTEPRFSLRHLLFVLPVAVLLFGTAWWLLARRGAPTDAPAPSVLKTTEIVSWRSAPGEVSSPGSFSPDGKMISFASTQSGTKNIWIKRVTSGEAVQITKDDFANEYPIWSPDGEEVAFFSRRGGRPGLWRMPVLGGAPRLLTKLELGDGHPKYWSPRGIIYYESKQNLFAFNLKSGQTTQITNLDRAATKANTVSISRDEERVSYISTAADGTDNLWYMPVRGGKAEQLTHDAYEHRNIVWHPKGDRILYSANIDGTFQTFAAYTGGPAPVQLTFGDKDSSVMDVSADGARVLFASAVEESDVWGVDVTKGAEFAFAQDTTAELWPDVAPDGRSVAYQSIKNLSQGDKLFSGAILTKPTGGETHPVQLVANGFLPTWSPDGNQLAFMRVAGETYSLLTINATGGEARQLTSGGIKSPRNNLLPYNRSQITDFSWSPDSSKVAYWSDRTGQSNLWIVAADGSRDNQVTNNADQNLWPHCPLWSSDGKWIAFTSELVSAPTASKRLYSVVVTEPETRAVKFVFQTESLLRLLGWSPDEKWLFFATLEQKTGSGSLGDVRLRQVSVETGEQRAVADLQSAYLSNIHLSVDRRMIAFTAHRDDKDNVWVVPTSGGEARRLTANSDPRLYFSTLSWSPDGRAIYFGKQSRRSVLSMIINYN